MMFEKTGLGNEVLYSPNKEFFISYREGGHPFGNGWNGKTDRETAIVVRSRRSPGLLVNNYYILEGDWRKEYADLVSFGLNDCLEFYRSHKDKWSQWSNPLPEEMGDG